MNLAQQIYLALGFPLVAYGNVRGIGIDLRNDHTRKTGPGRVAKHKKGARRLNVTDRTCPYWWADSFFAFRRNQFEEGV